MLVIRNLPLIVVGSLLSSCASVSVKEDQAKSAHGGLQMPSMIYVLPFDTDGEINVDREGAELEEFESNLKDMMVAALMERFPKHLAPAISVTSLDEVPEGNYWVVGGNFTRIEQGSRALRAIVGFGAGGTKVESDVFVYDASYSLRQPFRTFRTTGGSGATPGALTSLTPVTAVVSAASGSAKGLTSDVVRTSRMITADLSEYMYERGWISESQKLEAKR